MGYKAYKMIKRFFSDYRNRSTFLKNSDGKVTSDQTWKNYIEKLYENEQADTIQLSITRREDAIQYKTTYTKRRI